MKKLIVRKIFTSALLSIFLISSIFLASCKNAVDGGVGSGGGGGGSAPSPTPSSSSSGSDAPLYYENPLTGDKTPIDDYDGDPTNIPFVDIKDKLPTPEFGKPGYENSDGGVFAGWGTGDSPSTIITDDNTNVAGLELKPVYDTAVVFELWKYFKEANEDSSLGTYKVAEVLADKGIKFDTIESKILKSQNISKEGYEFHWTKEKGKIATATKNADVFKASQIFYTFYDGVPSAANHKENISEDELTGTEWMKKDASTGKYKYLIFKKIEIFDKIVAYGESNKSLEEAKERAQYLANDLDNFDVNNDDPMELFDKMMPYPDASNPVRYGATWEIAGNNNDEIYVWLSNPDPDATPVPEKFWMNESGKIIAKHDGDNISTDDMYKQQK